MLVFPPLQKSAGNVLWWSQEPKGGLSKKSCKHQSVSLGLCRFARITGILPLQFCQNFSVSLKSLSEGHAFLIMHAGCKAACNNYGYKFFSFGKKLIRTLTGRGNAEMMLVYIFLECYVDSEAIILDIPGMSECVTY